MRVNWPSLESIYALFHVFQGALYESEHIDENDIQTIVHRCDVLTHEEYVKRKLHLRMAKERAKCDSFYLAGRYDAGRGRMINTYI